MNQNDPPTEHILACLSSSPSNAKIVRTAATMAKAFGGSFTALYVKTPDADWMSAQDKQRLQQHIHMAEQAGADITTLYGDDISQQIAEFARISGITKIVLGRSSVHRRHFWSGPSLTEKLTLTAPNLDIYIIPDAAVEQDYGSGRRLFARSIVPSFRDLLITAGILACITVIGFLFLQLDFARYNSITSDKIRSSQMLSEIRVKDNGFYTGVPNLMHNASNGTLNTFVCALPDDELERIAEDADVPENSMEALLSGDSVLIRWGDCYYDPAADEYYQGFQPDGSTPVEPVFSAGDKLSIQYQRYTGQDEAGKDVYQTYAAELPIAGIVKSTADYTLLTTDRIFYNGMVFVSTALYHKMFEGAGSYHMEKEGYSSLNVKLAADNNFSLRRSIASIATRRNGILSADNYDLLSQSYTEGTQSAFLVGILAVLGVLLGCALLVVLNLSAYEVQQQRLSLLLTLGVSPKKLVCSYAKRVIPVIVGTTLIVNILVSVAVSHIVPIQSILDLIRIHTDGRVFEFHRPVGSQILVSILLMGFWLGAALLPVFSFIRKKASKGDIL